MMPDIDGYEVTRQLRKNPATVSIPILMFTAKTQLDDKVTGFDVGADDYLTKPTHPSELQSHVKALLARTKEKKSTPQTSLPEKQGFIIGVISVRGGLGVSTVAANLASALMSLTQSEVILAELTPGNGRLSNDLGVPSQTGLTKLLQGSVAEITNEKVQASLVKHKSGLQVLLASENPRDVNLTSQVQNFEVLVTHLASLARFTVLDLGSGLPTYAQKLLIKSNQQFVVLDGTAQTIQQTKILLEEILGLNIKKEKVAVILNNRQRVEGLLPAKSVQEKLEYPIAISIAPAPEVFLQASRVHATVVIAEPSNIISQHFLKIADVMVKREKAR
jgi:pilus assembly protein CpaE